MCSRYMTESEKEIQDIIKRYKLQFKSSDLNSDIYNREVFPSQIAPIITQDRELILSKWGFDKWDDKGIIINARSETLTTSRFFSPHLREGRCIVPASSYFEWLKVENGKPVKYRFSGKEIESLFMAGLIKRIDDTHSTFVIITRDAAADISFIHDRMPLIFDEEKCEKWLFDSFDESLLRSESVDVNYIIAS